MQENDYEIWREYTPVIYEYLSVHQMANTRSISCAKFTKQFTSQRNHKHTQFKTYICGKSATNNGFMGLYQMNVALREGTDIRTKTQINKICWIDFERQIQIFEECHIESSSRVELTEESIDSEYFIALVEAQNPEIMIYPSKVFENYQMQAKTTVNPRLTLKGHLEQPQCLKSQQSILLSGTKDGQLKIFDLKSGENQSLLSYRYHQNAITDCCWLDEQRQSNIFASVSCDQRIYIWDKRTNIPTDKINAQQEQLSCIEKIDRNCFVTGGKSGRIKFWDIRQTQRRFYAYSDVIEPTTKLLKISRNRKQASGKNPMFASGSIYGTTTLWQDDAFFCHLAHKIPISSISYDSNTDVLLTSDIQNMISIWKPAVFTEV